MALSANEALVVILEKVANDDVMEYDEEIETEAVSE
jgi:hypothetical protein